MFANYRPMFTICQVYYLIVGVMFYKEVGILLGGSLSLLRIKWGVLTEDDGVWFLGYYSLYVNLLKCSVVPEVLEVQVVASEEVSMVPKAPTATKVLFP